MHYIMQEENNWTKKYFKYFIFLFRLQTNYTIDILI